jgi:hypothetical protein
MQRPSGNAAVRLTLWTVLATSFLVALVQPVLGGTLEAPEIQDPANDQAVVDTIPCTPLEAAADCPAGSRIDIVTVWIDTETATTFNVNILTTGVPGGATTASAQWDFHATFAGTEVVATATAVGGATPGAPVPGANVATAAVDGNTLILTIAKSVYGAPVAGSTLTGMFVQGTSTIPAPLPFPLPAATDRAPNEGAGADYIFTGGSGAAPDPNDTDGDGLNDTCEQQYFGNLTAQNATGDPDGDGLTNGQECALGTDPTNADTDGDGTPDNLDPFPTDPTRGGPSSTTTSTSRSSTSSSTSRSSSTTGGGGDDDKVESLGDAIDKLQSDAGYLGMSSGGLLAVLVLCVIALAVRWSL